MQKSKPKLSDDRNKSLYAYARYSSLAFQMIVIILLFVFAGFKLDELTGWSFPLFKLIFSLLGVVLALYFALKDFIHKS